MGSAPASEEAALDGTRAALSDRGLGLNSGFLRKGDYDRRAALNETKRLMGFKRPPPAIFAHDDNMAIGVREALLGFGAGHSGKCGPARDRWHRDRVLDLSLIHI